MIDWYNLAANSLWILGCSLALAIFSYASWQASVYKQKLRTRLGTAGAQKALNLSGVLFCAGLAATSGSTLEIVLWALLAILFVVGFFLSMRPVQEPENTVPPQS